MPGKTIPLQTTIPAPRVAKSAAYVCYYGLYDSTAPRLVVAVNRVAVSWFLASYCNKKGFFVFSHHHVREVVLHSFSFLFGVALQVAFQRSKDRIDLRRTKTNYRALFVRALVRIVRMLSLCAYAFGAALHIFYLYYNVNHVCVPARIESSVPGPH